MANRGDTYALENRIFESFEQYFIYSFVTKTGNLDNAFNDRGRFGTITCGDHGSVGKTEAMDHLKDPSTCHQKKKPMKSVHNVFSEHVYRWAQHKCNKTVGLKFIAPGEAKMA